MKAFIPDHITPLLTGKYLMRLSVLTRFFVLTLLVFMALWTYYLNFKVGYNNPRLVELDSGLAMRLWYQFSDGFFSFFGDPVEVMQSNGGMTWSIRVFGLPFTDPVAALSVLVKSQSLKIGFALGLLVPLGLAVLFGRVFCAYICPASLVFYSVARVRMFLSKFFYFPDVNFSPGFAWGVLLGGLVLAFIFGHGVWTFFLPYFAIGQTIFHGLAFGTLSMTLVSLGVFILADLTLGPMFTCRYLCPTGRILGLVGIKSVFSLKRDSEQCLDTCHTCQEVCPAKLSPKTDQTNECTLCGECMIMCPTECLSIGRRNS